MKKAILLTTICLFFIPMLLIAQDEELKKPKDIGVAEFDEFKNNSFSIYKSSLEFKTRVDNGETLSADDVKAVKKLQEDVAAMSEKTEKMIKNASNVKPMTKAPQAGKNTKASGKALKFSSANLQYVLDNMITEE